MAPPAMSVMVHAVRLFKLLVGFTFAMIASPATRAATGRLRLMTYNINVGNPSPDPTLDAIEAGDADVVLLQEITTEWQRSLVRRFAKRYPHRMFRLHGRSAGGLGVLSKLPIETEEVLPPPRGGWYFAERLVIGAPFGPLQILHVHLRPALDGGSWIKGFLTTPPLRRREIEAFWKRLVRGLPTIVAGDFNEDPSGSALRFLAREGLVRVPAVGPATWHYETTVNGKTSDLIKFDLDHVMIDRSLVASEAQVLDAGTSDHRPVVATITPRA